METKNDLFKWPGKASGSPVLLSVFFREVPVFCLLHTITHILNIENPKKILKTRANTEMYKIFFGNMSTYKRICITLLKQRYYFFENNQHSLKIYTFLYSKTKFSKTNKHKNKRAKLPHKKKHSSESKNYFLHLNEEAVSISVQTRPLRPNYPRKKRAIAVNTFICQGDAEPQKTFPNTAIYSFDEMCRTETVFYTRLP